MSTNEEIVKKLLELYFQNKEGENTNTYIDRIKNLKPADRTALFDRGVGVIDLSGLGDSITEQRKARAEMLSQYWESRGIEASGWPWDVVVSFIQDGDHALYPKGSGKKGQFTQEEYVAAARAGVLKASEQASKDGGALDVWNFYEVWRTEGGGGKQSAHFQRKVNKKSLAGQTTSTTTTGSGPKTKLWSLYHRIVEGGIHFFKDETSDGEPLWGFDGRDMSARTDISGIRSKNWAPGKPGPFFLALTEDNAIGEKGDNFLGFQTGENLSSIASIDGDGIEDSKVEEGDYSDYSQCLILASYLKSPKMEINYFAKQGLLAKQGDPTAYWSDRIIPLWLEDPDKFINYSIMPPTYSDFFKNLQIDPQTGNFLKINEEYRPAIDPMAYSKMVLKTSLKYIYTEYNSDNTPTIIDVPIRNNSVETLQGDYFKLRIANDISSRVVSDDDAMVIKESGGIFNSLQDIKDFISSVKNAANTGENNNFYHLENVDIKFDGTNPSTARKDVQVSLKFICDSFHTFSTYEISDKGLLGKDFKGNSKKITLADLVSLPTTGKTINDSEPGGFIKNQFSPNYNRLQLSISHFNLVQERVSKEESTTESDDNFGGRGVGTQGHRGTTGNNSAGGDTISFKKVSENEWIKTSKADGNDMILDLSVIDHTIERDPATGFITFTVNYRGYFDSMLTTPACDALADKRINDRRSQRDKLLRNAARIGCTRNEIKEIMDKNQATAQLEKDRAMASIIERLATRGRLYVTDIPTSHLKSFVQTGHLNKTARESVDIIIDIESPVGGGTSIAQLLGESDIDRAESEDIELQDRNWGGDVAAGFDAAWDKYVTGEGSEGFSDAYGASDIYQKYRDGRSWRTWSFFLGDLLDVISDSIYEEGTSVHHKQYKAMNLKFMASTFAIPDFFSEVGEDHDDILRNILSVPISLDFFKKWFNENVTNKDLLFYPMGTMIKDLVERVISGLLYETCLSSPTDTPPIFRIGYFTDCRKRYNLMRTYKFQRRSTAVGQWSPWLDWKTASLFSYNRDKALFHMDSSVETKDRKNYCVIYCMKSMVMNRKLTQNIYNDEDSFENFVPVICYGTNNIGANYLSDVKFSKTSTPGLREARYFGSANGGLSLLSNVYDLSFSFSKMAANTFFYPGSVFDFRLLDKGMGSPHDKKSLAYHMGFGGYHMVKSVNYNLNVHASDYQITVDSKFIGTKQPEDPWRNFPNASAIEAAVDAKCDDLIIKSERVFALEQEQRNADEAYNSISSDGVITIEDIEDDAERATLASEEQELLDSQIEAWWADNKDWVMEAVKARIASNKETAVKNAWARKENLRWGLDEYSGKDLLNSTDKPFAKDNGLDDDPDYYYYTGYTDAGIEEWLTTGTLGDPDETGTRAFNPPITDLTSNDPNSIGQYLIKSTAILYCHDDHYVPFVRVQYRNGFKYYTYKPTGASTAAQVAYNMSRYGADASKYTSEIIEFKPYIDSTTYRWSTEFDYG